MRPRLPPSLSRSTRSLTLCSVHRPSHHWPLPPDPCSSPRHSPLPDLLELTSSPSSPRLFTSPAGPPPVPRPPYCQRPDLPELGGVGRVGRQGRRLWRRPRRDGRGPAGAAREGRAGSRAREGARGGRAPGAGRRGSTARLVAAFNNDLDRRLDRFLDRQPVSRSRRTSRRHGPQVARPGADGRRAASDPRPARGQGLGRRACARARPRGDRAREAGRLDQDEPRRRGDGARGRGRRR